MLELGPEAPHWHRELGRQATEAGADRLVAFGRHADDVVRGAAETGMAPHRLASCEDLETVLLQLDCWLEPGDLVAVKGSRGMRMERIVDWLRDRATEFPVATASLRDCA
jgi:UDP-N-acetylmuramoyl-tripeptide--D-alanyl-D-alanine ligase